MSAVAVKTTRQKHTRLSKEGIGREYEGLLAEPMYRPHLLMSPSEKGDWVLLRASKTILLFKHFSIDPNAEDAWQRLAISLAENHVPGFMPPAAKQGHPKDYGFDLELCMRVELLKLRDGMKVRPAVDRIAKAQIFEQNSEALRTRYREARKNKHLKPMFEMFDRCAESIGQERFIEALDESVGDRLR